MRVRISFIRGVISVAMAYLLHVTAVFSFFIYESCAKMPEDGGGAEASLRVTLREDVNGTKASSLFGLDTNSFILKVYSQNGEKVYDGKYGNRPERFTVSGGAYNVGIISEEFSKPLFNEYVIGAKSDMVIKGGEDACVDLLCSQMNCGVKITCSSEFMNHFQGRGIFLNNSTFEPVVNFGCSSSFYGNSGLFYSSSQTGFGCFSPGVLNFYIRRGSAMIGEENKPLSGDSLLFSRQVDAGQMLTFQFDWSAGGTKSSFRIDVDTVREWISEVYNPGCIVPDDAVTIDEAKSMVGQSGIKVFGYIIGGDVTEKTFRTSPPFSVVSNLLLAPSMSERNRNNCFAVELPSSSNARENLNLVSHPELIGKAVVLTGRVVEKYMGYTGLKGVKEYSILF